MNNSPFSALSERPLSPPHALEVVRAAVLAAAAGRSLSTAGKLKALDALDVLDVEVAK